MKPSVCIVGCGRLGTALAISLTEKAYPVTGVSSLNLSSAKKLAGLCNIPFATDKPWEITIKADVVFLTTPDGAIESACEQISGEKGFREDSVILHCSGAHPSSILSSARKSFAKIGSMHPLQSFASTDSYHNSFKGINVAVEGDPAAVSMASEIAKDMEAFPVEISTEGKPLYHAAAVVASNFLVTLIGISLKLIQNSGIPAEKAYLVLKPLVEGTLSNIGKVGVHQALTGPVVRGDVKTIETHINAIGKNSPDLLPFYNCLIKYTALEARKGERISEDLLKIITSLSDNQDQ